MNDTDEEYSGCVTDADRKEFIEEKEREQKELLEEQSYKFTEAELKAIAMFSSVVKFGDLLQQLRDTAPPEVKQKYKEFPTEKKKELAALLHNNQLERHNDKCLTLAWVISQLDMPEGVVPYISVDSRNKMASSDDAKLRSAGVVPIVADLVCTTKHLQTRKRKYEDSPWIFRKKPRLAYEIVDEREAFNLMLNGARNWSDTEKKWREEFSNSSFETEFSYSFNAFANHARSLLEYSSVNFKFEEVIVIDTDLNGRFGILWIKPWPKTPTRTFTKEYITLMACNEASQYGNLTLEKPEEILEAIYLLLWRLADPISTANEEKKVIVFSKPLGPSLCIEVDEENTIEVVLIEPLKVSNESAILKVSYNDCPCILKIGMYDRIQSEVSAFMALGNQLDNIPRLILRGEVDELPCLLMTLMEGAPLFSLIKPVGVADVLTITAQLLEFITQLHRLGYSHNDLHPGNILWCSQTQKVHVIDFDRCKKNTELNSIDDYVFLSVLQQFLLSEDINFSDELDERFDAVEAI